MCSHEIGEQEEGCQFFHLVPRLVSVWGDPTEGNSVLLMLGMSHHCGIRGFLPLEIVRIISRPLRDLRGPMWFGFETCPALYGVGTQLDDI